MALTATASADTQCSVVESLDMRNPLVVSQCLNRPNIFYSASAMKGMSVSIHVIDLGHV